MSSDDWDYSSSGSLSPTSTSRTVGSDPIASPVGVAKKTSGILDILPFVLDSHPDVIAPLLFSGNIAVHQVACTQAFRELQVELEVPGTLGHRSFGADDTSRPCCTSVAMRRKVHTVLRDSKYARYVRILRFQHPCPSHLASEFNGATKTSDRAEQWEFAAALIDHVPFIEEFVWETGLGLGPDLWKSLASLKHLKVLRLRYPPDHPSNVVPPCYPRLTPDLQSSECARVVPSTELDPFQGRPRAVGLNGLALGTAWENLQVLCLEGLTAQGARSIASHLQILADLPDYTPQLHTLSIWTHFADLRLCESIGRFGALKCLRHLTIGTSGTKLTAECLRRILEGCTALESLKLDDVEGRLEKNTWETMPSWPETLKSFEIDSTEAGSHHSWVLKHLDSIHRVPIAQLRRFCVRRQVHPIAAMPFPPPGVVVPPVLPTHKVEPISPLLVDVVIEDGKLLEELCLDWWEMTLEQFEQVLLACPRLKKLQVAVMGSLIDIIGMSAAFGSVPDLVELSITSRPIYSAASLTSKFTKSKKDTAMYADLPPFLVSRIAEGDPQLIEVRELRKFIRRLPLLRVLRWVGRDGKGEWRFPLPTKKATLAPIQFYHSAVLTKEAWLNCQRPAPSFEFDEEPSGSIPMALEPQVSPLTPSRSEFPTLPRSATWSGFTLPLTDTPPSTKSVSGGRTSSSSSTDSAFPGFPALGLELDGSVPLTGNSKLDAPQADNRKFEVPQAWSSRLKALAKEAESPSAQRPARGMVQLLSSSKKLPFPPPEPSPTSLPWRRASEAAQASRVQATATSGEKGGANHRRDPSSGGGIKNAVNRMSNHGTKGGAAQGSKSPNNSGRRSSAQPSKASSSTAKDRSKNRSPKSRQPSANVTPVGPSSSLTEPVQKIVPGSGVQKPRRWGSMPAVDKPNEKDAGEEGSSHTNKKQTDTNGEGWMTVGMRRKAKS